MFELPNFFKKEENKDKEGKGKIGAASVGSDGYSELVEGEKKDSLLSEEEATEIQNTAFDAPKESPDGIKETKKKKSADAKNSKTNRPFKEWQN